MDLKYAVELGSLHHYLACNDLLHHHPGYDCYNDDSKVPQYWHLDKSRHHNYYKFCNKVVFGLLVQTLIGPRTYLGPPLLYFYALHHTVVHSLQCILSSDVQTCPIKVLTAVQIKQNLFFTTTWFCGQPPQILKQDTHTYNI